MKGKKKKELRNYEKQNKQRNNRIITKYEINSK